MKHMLRWIVSICNMFGFNIKRLFIAITCFPVYILEMIEFYKQKRNHPGHSFDIMWPLPCLGERYGQGGNTNAHYFHQDLIVAQCIFCNRPNSHYDVGSRVDGFVGHVASFREITVIDIRPIKPNNHNIKYVQANIMDDLRPELVGCCDSLSCLHALEHFGLGRYGDPIKYDGHIIGINNLRYMLNNNGVLYLSVPIGPQRVEYNAHRIFSVSYIMKQFIHNKFDLISFSYVDDSGYLHINAQIDSCGVNNNYQCYYGCGIFVLIKR
jgi:hypothetical protein